jgi:hypothetical protein
MPVYVSNVMAMMSLKILHPQLASTTICSGGNSFFKI